MSASNLFETGVLNLVFKNIAFANIGNAGGLQPSTVAGSFFLALMQTDPGEAGSGTEADYSGYARQPITRGAGFTVLNNQVKNAAAVVFPTNGAAPVNVLTHWAIFTALTGGDLLFSGGIGSSLSCGQGVTPQVNADGLVISAD